MFASLDELHIDFTLFNAVDGLCVINTHYVMIIIIVVVPNIILLLLLLLLL